MSPVIVAIFSTAGVIGAAYLAYLGIKVQSKSQQQTTDSSVGATSLVAAVEKWREIAERAESKADEALRRSAAAEYEARAAREQNERLESDVLSLVSFLRAMWAGFINGTVPPALPIPDRLRHLLSPADFPNPRNRERP